MISKNRFYCKNSLSMENTAKYLQNINHHNFIEGQMKAHTLWHLCRR